jgi:hypothetical protein
VTRKERGRERAPLDAARATSAASREPAGIEQTLLDLQGATGNVGIQRLLDGHPGRGRALHPSVERLLVARAPATRTGRTAATATPLIQRDFLSSVERGWEMYSGMSDEGAGFARELMRWRMLGLGADFEKFPWDGDWNQFMAARPEIQRAMADYFRAKVVDLSTHEAGATGAEVLPWNWESFDGQITGVALNELESMRLTLHGCHRIEIRGDYHVETQGSDKIVKLSTVTFTWVDRADLHPGTGTQLESGAVVDDSEFTGAGWDYDIRIQFMMPGESTWTVSGGSATHTRGWPPTTGAPQPGVRG